jgi:hypothetical protein
MKADEIRRYVSQVLSRKDAEMREELVVEMLAEIAAQLAELNRKADEADSG